VSGRPVSSATTTGAMAASARVSSGESFELGTTSALGAPLSPRDKDVVASERGAFASEPRRSDELAASCGHLGGAWS